MSKFLTPPVWYDSEGNLAEILTGISKDGGVGMGEGTNAGSGAVVIGNDKSIKNIANGQNRVWIGHTSNKNVAKDERKNVVIGLMTTGRTDNSGQWLDTLALESPSSVIIGGNISGGTPELSPIVTDSVFINTNVQFSGSQPSSDGFIVIGAGTFNPDNKRVHYVQIGSTDQSYTFAVGNRNVFGAIDTAANTFSISGGKYKAKYDSASSTLNFIIAT